MALVESTPVLAIPVSISTIAIVSFAAFILGVAYESDAFKKKRFAQPASFLSHRKHLNSRNLKPIQIVIAIGISIPIILFMYISKDFEDFDRDLLRVNTMRNEHPDAHPIELIDVQWNGNITDNGDYPWGHVYRARIWCSVLTVWPERRQNIEVTF